jgi:surfactin synthase thioesterase subunit
MTGQSFPRWLLRRPSDEAAARVFCFPYSGVGASMFNRWPRVITPDSPAAGSRRARPAAPGGVEVCPVQLPARENRVREPHHGSYRALAEAVVEPLAPYLDRPFVFFGHCAGALPAFETAVRLAELDLPVPRRIVVSAQVAPQDCPHDRFLDLDDEQLTAELAQVVVSRGGLPHPLLLELTLQVLHQDLAANREYRRATPLPVPSGITVVSWSDDAEIGAPLLRGWRDWSHDVRFAELPGGHYEFLTAPPQLLDLIADSATPMAVTP